MTVHGPDQPIRFTSQQNKIKVELINSTVHLHSRLRLHSLLLKSQARITKVK